MKKFVIYLMMPVLFLSCSNVIDSVEEEEVPIDGPSKTVIDISVLAAIVDK